MQLGPSLETPRLILRPPQAGDFEAWAAFKADAEATRHIGGIEPRSAAYRSFAAMVGVWYLQGSAMFSVIEKATGEWVGRVGPWQPEGWPGTEVGWSIVRDRWGRGYGPEAAVAAIDWAFDELHWSEVIHTIAPDNVNSKAVAAKLGSTLLRVGRLPAPYDTKDIEIWGQSRGQWLARRERQQPKG
ncbi:GNAT family N-acetyltransferase [Lysobacter sp. LF1]|uniref:GNAT family N-acetyltransferase n=1 Tax=Lysobacter stagni TaxID=3045172 RepID=A0ABT6XJI5_9GAMM|nr:GNAT family N-acetyltransferase [Lysobacter sp. LF1]MDI9240196.1 GNAT family N-acetyltransferase [Lysobacter sp. LF1]